MYRGRQGDFLPVDAGDLQARGWQELDFLCVVGDAYVDHPSFGHAVVGRFLESLGYRVGIVAQPDWRSTADFVAMGRPRLGVLVAAGNLDSMLSNYVSRNKPRRVDAYAPEGEAGRRPDRATIVYCNRIRELWDDIPLIVGGVEASLRRLAHYDYWSDSVRRSILVDSRADLLIYGMAESQLKHVAAYFSDEGTDRCALRDVPGTCWKTHDPGEAGENALLLPSFERVATDKRAFAQAFADAYRENNFAAGRRVVQDQGPWYVVQNPPPPPLATGDMDRIYSLPYMRMAHPMYAAAGVPALEEVRFSITTHRGCFGECAFCAIASHQGRTIQPRSDESVLREARIIAAMEDFKGYIHDLGGPTANFCENQCEWVNEQGPCQNRSCLFPEPCPKLRKSHGRFLRLLRKVRELPGMKKVFVRSGLRYDYILADPNGTAFLRELCEYHVSGQLKIAPEHASGRVLKAMRKAPADCTTRFVRAYRKMNQELGKKQFLVPYFMSAHPGSTLRDALLLAEYMRDNALRPEQAQEFTPTPGTLAACMFHTGLDPMTGECLHVAYDPDERAMQRALLQYWMPKNHPLVRKALLEIGRADLIGVSKGCLVPAEERKRFSSPKR